MVGSRDPDRRTAGRRTGWCGSRWSGRGSRTDRAVSIAVTSVLTKMSPIRQDHRCCPPSGWLGRRRAQQRTRARTSRVRTGLADVHPLRRNGHLDLIELVRLFSARHEEALRHLLGSLLWDSRRRCDSCGLQRRTRDRWPRRPRSRSCSAPPRPPLCWASCTHRPPSRAGRSRTVSCRSAHPSRRCRSTYPIPAKSVVARSGPQPKVLLATNSFGPDWKPDQGFCLDTQL